MLGKAPPLSCEPVLICIFFKSVYGSRCTERREAQSPGCLETFEILSELGSPWGWGWGWGVTSSSSQGSSVWLALGLPFCGSCLAGFPLLTVALRESRVRGTVLAGLRGCIKQLTAVFFCLQYGPQGRADGLGGGRAARWLERGGEPAGLHTPLGRESGFSWATTVKRLFRSAHRQVSTSAVHLARHHSTLVGWRGIVPEP